MARPLRIQYPGAVYHLMSRGDGGKKIFKDSHDYEMFLGVFEDVLERHNWISYAYCLMPNHYHLLVQTIDPNLSEGMRQLNGIYTQKYNFRHDRYGHVFQGRYKSILVDLDDYKYQIIRYIALNPVRAKLTISPYKYKWSSHLEMLNKQKPSGCLHTQKALKLFDKNNTRAREIYKEYIGSKIDDEDLKENIHGGIVLGGIEFMEKIKKYIQDKKDIKDISKKERFAHRPKLIEIFKNIKNKEERNKKIAGAHLKYGYSLSEIGRELNMHHSSIGKIVQGERK